MKNKGSRIWWFVGIALALAWAFSASADNKTQDSSQLDSGSEGFQLLDQAQKRSAELQPSGLPLHMQQPLEASPAPWQQQPVRTHEPDLHLTRSAGQSEQVLPFVDLSEPQEQIASTEELPQLAATSELEEFAQWDELEDFDSMEMEPTLAEPNDAPQLVELESGMVDTMEPSSAMEQSFAAPRQSHEQFTKSTNTLNSNSKVVSNPFFAEADSGNGIAERKSNPQKVQNRFFTESNADLFADEASAPNRKIEATATRAKTEYASFENLKSGQDQWVKSINSNDIASPHISNDITPILPRGEQLHLAPGTLQRCVNHIEQGRSLARRRAAYAAREEFFAALRVIAQSHDAQTKSKAYTSALSRAIVALNEVDDFFAERTHSGMDIDVLTVIEGHETKVIPKQIAQNMSSLDAIQVYFDYSRQTLHEALGNGPAASEALYSLGKLFTLSATHQLSGNPFDYAKATVMHHAALDCDSQNYRSSNELGVLMARNGRLEKARNLFRDSLVVKQVPDTWRNLAMVHQKLAQLSEGEVSRENQRLAQMANQEYTVASQQAAANSGRVQWVSPEAYNPENSISFSESRVAELPVEEAPRKPSLIKSLFR